MIPTAKVEQIVLKDGRTITLETGKLAKQADGSVVVKMGGTMILATVVASKEAKDGIDFLPLTVDYREKYYAGGKIPGGFLKREARPSDEEVLNMRLVDRVLRPLFPKDYHCEVQLMMSLISYDGVELPDSLVGLAASTALSLTDIPFNGPISEVRVARIKGEFVTNPNSIALKEADLNIMVGASEDSVVMVEGEMDEVSEQEMIAAIRFAHEEIKTQLEAQKRLIAQVGVSSTKRAYKQAEENEQLKEEVKSFAYQSCYDIVKEVKDKHERADKFAEVLESFKERYTEEEYAEVADLAKKYFSGVKKEAIRNLVLDQDIRLDGRSSTDIRAIWSEVDYLPGAHGSAVFTRGETQSLTTVTLGTSLDANRIDNVTNQTEEKFYLHYNFPPFSTGEARPIRGVSRREIGHGNLAQRALVKMIPEDCPYVLRVVSDILESNGSSSMATVCAGTLALMDTGISIKRPVSGIAMGLISDQETGRWKVLSDILGDEDHLGDMDFKVTGTEKGITACQMDIKIKGLDYDVLEKALLQAKEGRAHILGEMLKTLPEPRKEMKDNAPKIISISIPANFIGAIIGPGGKVIQEMQKETETVITIEEDGEFGKVYISGVNKELMDKALLRIQDITFVPEVGSIYQTVVKSVKPFGVFVEIKRGLEGLVHVSELKWERIDNVEDVMNVGDALEVKYIGIDPKTKKMRLSAKVLLPKPE